MLRWFASAVVMFGLCLSSRSALGDPAQRFIEAGSAQVALLLKQPPSPQRDIQLRAVIDTMFDYDELTRRSFGADWSTLTVAQQAQVTRLFADIVRTVYRKTIERASKVTMGPSIRQGQDRVVETFIRSFGLEDMTPIRMDYVFTPWPGPFHVVDLVTEKSSLTARYQNDVHRMLTTSGQGYLYLVAKLAQTAARLSAVWSFRATAPQPASAPPAPSPSTGRYR